MLAAYQRMVMETPSPQCVGLEFVRQYYTVLNKAPMHLHRFYSHNSSFMHGGQNSMSDPIIGQSDIHKKIVSLNFRDCHAKIRMVDAHATLSEGVVVQVTGELSNNGMPMRRFMQTFVLAPQTPKKYYVHNDIFRYQDEVFIDEEGGEEGGSEVEEEVEPPPATEVYTPSAPTAINGTAHPPEPEPTPPAVAQPAPVVTPPAPVPVSTPTVVAPVTPASAPSPTPPAPTPAETAPPVPTTPEKAEPEDLGWTGSNPEGWSSTENSSWDEPQVPVKEKTPDPEPAQPDPQPQTQPQPQPVSNEPKTFANLFKSSGYNSAAAPAPAAVPAAAAAPPTHTQPPAHSTETRQETKETPPQRSAVPTGNTQPSQTQTSGGNMGQRPTRNPQGRPQGPRDRSARPGSEDASDMDNVGQWEDRRRGIPDSQQIFVGNLPLVIGEEELRAEFSRFGKIVDIRINTAKSKAPKTMGHIVPNFGFITFEDESAVSKCLNARPIMLNGDQRLNVEEKKARSKPDGSNMGRPNSGRGGMGGMRQGGLPGGRGGGGPRMGGQGFSRDNSRGGPGGARGAFAQRR
ncbi:ras GTPase-activating protein-binding protein 2 isoform X2 [Oratosquilla oratoria]|uniref:ras GTPase-activating protein-binding protein 2 isoform X2 n=1 Tax=Oratosquilla oratoria TaxID=337810 RepID=UPI003F75860D